MRPTHAVVKLRCHSVHILFSPYRYEELQVAVWSKMKLLIKKMKNDQLQDEEGVLKKGKILYFFFFFFLNQFEAEAKKKKKSLALCCVWCFMSLRVCGEGLMAPVSVIKSDLWGESVLYLLPHLFFCAQIFKSCGAIHWGQGAVSEVGLKQSYDYQVIPLPLLLPQQQTNLLVRVFFYDRWITTLKGYKFTLTF